MSYLSDAELGTIVRKATVNTSGNYGARGILNPEQSSRFIDMIQESSEFLKKTTFEKRRAKQGTISKLGIGTRLLRGFIENTDNITDKEVNPVIGEIPYNVKKMILGSSITEDWFQDNIEQKGFENHFMGMIAKQIQVDILDLAFNGDEAINTSNPDYEFLSINDGWIKQIRDKGHKVDGASINGGKFSKAYFYALRRAVPKKYRTQAFRWICSDDTYIDLSEYISERNTQLGDLAIISGGNMKVLETPFETIPNFPNDVILYADPKNLVSVATMDIKHRKTIEGKTAVYEDKRFYADILNMDFIIMEIDATGILINKGELA